MRYLGKIATVVALIFAVATPALAGRATPAERLEMDKKMMVCKKEVAEQHSRMHVQKKRAYIKECMARA